MTDEKKDSGFGAPDSEFHRLLDEYLNGDLHFDDLAREAYTKNGFPADVPADSFMKALNEIGDGLKMRAWANAKQARTKNRRITISADADGGGVQIEIKGMTSDMEPRPGANDRELNSFFVGERHKNKAGTKSFDVLTFAMGRHSAALLLSLLMEYFNSLDIAEQEARMHAGF